MLFGAVTPFFEFAATQAAGGGRLWCNRFLMRRRQFLYAAAGAGAATSGEAQAPAGIVKAVELRYYRMRNGNQTKSTQQFLEKAFLPAAKRAGIGPVGVFSGIIAEASPSLLCLIGYPSFEAISAAPERMAADKEYAASCDAYNSGAEANYVRIESWLLKAFGSVEQIAFEPASGKPWKVFELRTYESPNTATLARKIGMFESGGEIAIFRRTGVYPVFFGETIAGPKMPNLTYMVGFEDTAAREKAWSMFGGDPEWQKLRLRPGLADAEVVSNISNSLWRPIAATPRG